MIWSRHRSDGGVDGCFPSLYTDGLQSIIQALGIVVRYLLSPDVLRDALRFMEYAKVWTRLSLQPLEVIDLIPLVRRQVDLRCLLCNRLARLA
jgi:hypothetical protein